MQGSRKSGILVTGLRANLEFRSQFVGNSDRNRRKLIKYNNSVLKGNIITSPDMIKVCLIAQNFQIWCKGLGVRGRELRLSTCLLVTNNKSPRIVDSQTKILGANFTSKPFGYEPKNIFCSPADPNHGSFSFFEKLNRNHDAIF